jgi:DNA-binding transcriptional LysR family regulator
MREMVRLRTLVEVARRGSFSAAADALDFTQPSVSRQIATLEAEVGAQLLERLPRRVRLTEAGRILVEHAEAIDARLEAAQDEIDALLGLEGGHIRISAFGSANARLVPEALRRFAGRYPKVELTLAGFGTPDALSALRSGGVDLALVTSLDIEDPRDRDGIELVHLFGDRLYLALPREHRLARRRRLSLLDLGQETWIEGGHPDCLGSLEELGQLIGAEPKIGFYCEDWIGKQALVGAGVGIMLFPHLALGDLRDDIVIRRLPRTLRSREIYVALPSGYRAPGVGEMVACLREVADSKSWGKFDAQHVR